MVHLISKITGVLLIASLWIATAPVAAAQICDPRAFGATPNDDMADTEGLQRAINACANTGGTVEVLGGRYLSGTLRLGSNMTFRLGAGVVLAAIPDINQFPEVDDVAVDATSGGTLLADGYDRFRSFLLAQNVHNLTIEGPGRLDGQGPLFWDPGFLEGSAPRPTLPRPQQMVELADCSNVIVRGLTLVQAPAYSIRFNRCNGVRAENVTVRNDPRSPNTDGIQIRDTSNAFITGADIDTGDDAIVIKSQLRIVDNVIVTNSILRSDDSALKFGTAGYVGIQNTLFSNIIIRESRYGIALFQMDGGAYLNNRFENISIETGGRGTRQFAIFVDIDRRTVEAPLGRIEGLAFRDIELQSGANVLISGQPDQPIRDLTIDGLAWRTPGTVEAITPDRRKPRGNTLLGAAAAVEDHADEPSMITLANIERASVRGLSIFVADAGAQRSFLTLIRVSDGDFAALDFANSTAQAAPAIVLRDSADISLRGVARPLNIETFLSVSGAHAGGLSLVGADLSGVTTPWTLAEGLCLDADAVLLARSVRRNAERSICRR
jgi:hypothetical protein